MLALAALVLAPKYEVAFIARFYNAPTNKAISKRALYICGLHGENRKQISLKVDEFSQLRWTDRDTIEWTTTATPGTAENFAIQNLRFSASRSQSFPIPVGNQEQSPGRSDSDSSERAIADRRRRVGEYIRATGSLKGPNMAADSVPSPKFNLDNIAETRAYKPGQSATASTPGTQERSSNLAWGQQPQGDNPIPEAPQRGAVIYAAIRNTTEGGLLYRYSVKTGTVKLVKHLEGIEFPQTPDDPNSSYVRITKVESTDKTHPGTLLLTGGMANPAGLTFELNGQKQKLDGFDEYTTVDLTSDPKTNRVWIHTWDHDSTLGAKNSLYWFNWTTHKLIPLIDQAHTYDFDPTRPLYAAVDHRNDEKYDGKHTVWVARARAGNWKTGEKWTIAAGFVWSSAIALRP